MKYINRKIEKVLEKFITAFPVVAITGPRQSGKSTLLLSCLKDYQYISMDDDQIVQQFYDDPNKFMSIYSNKVIIDEVQKVPEIFNYIKIQVDKDRNNYGKYVLTGSSQFLMLEKITESLAGRLGLLTLLPFQYNEIENLNPSIFQGSFPELVNRNYRLWIDWYASYIETYINRDLRQISNIGNLRDFRRFVQILAANVSQILDMTSLSNQIGVSVPTIKRWISILETSYIIFLLPPYFKNLGKQITKRPKLYFYDTGLVSYLTGVETFKLYEQGPLSGQIFENYIISEILKKELHSNSHSSFYYYRTNHGVEIDLIVDKKRIQQFIEIKKSHTFRPRMMKHLETLEQNFDQGYLLYEGKTMPSTKHIKIINYSDYLS